MHGETLELAYFFTDFGAGGIYVGQMMNALLAEAPKARVIDLVNDAPSYSPKPAAYLLGALGDQLQPGSVLVGVVDPGVGTERDPLLLEWEGRYLVGPDNGLFCRFLKRPGVRGARILWSREGCSVSFHGRDLFAPVAGRLLRGREVATEPVALEQLRGWDWPEDLEQVIYLDGFGNAITGIQACHLGGHECLQVGHHLVRRAKVFGSVSKGTAFWYSNSLGLVEIAVNQGRAADDMGLEVGTPVRRV